MTHVAEHGDPHPWPAADTAAPMAAAKREQRRLERQQRRRAQQEAEPWYNRKGFFEHKLEDPSIYDNGKEKDPREHLRMPKPYLTARSGRPRSTTFLLGSVGAEGANVPAALFYNPTDQQKAIQDGWWVIKKYNCMGCHSVQVGQRSTLWGLPQYQPGGTLGDMQLGPDQLPPGLTTEGARVDPDWLLRFLSDPSLSGYSEGIDLGAHGGKPAAASARGKRRARDASRTGSPARAAGAERRFRVSPTPHSPSRARPQRARRRHSRAGMMGQTSRRSRARTATASARTCARGCRPSTSRRTSCARSCASSSPSRRSRSRTSSSSSSL